MFKTIKYTLFNSIVIAAFIISACATESTPTPAMESGIQTAIALTVAAQNAQPATAVPTAIGTQTPLQFSPTLTPLAPVASPTKPSTGTTQSECASAFLVSETIPDGTIYAPGQQFTKTWEIRNTSTCTWDTGYKIVFWNGDILGGAYVYNLPQITPPQAVVPISLVLTAPTSSATYKSEWMIQTPDDIAFGVGEYSNVPFYAEIVVSTSTSPGYTVTGVTYSVVRDPATGCPANVNYIVTANITTNGPLEFSYIWLQQDGNSGSTNVGPGKGTIKMEAAGTTSITREWKLHLGSAPGSQRWIALAVTVDEEYIEFFPGQYFTYLCGS
jgi:hypothetical protein